MVGLFWGLIPTVQLLAVIATWIVARRVFKWDFGLMIAILWTGVTNVVTAAPIYYTFYIAGQLMLGEWHGLPTYRGFLAQWHAAVSPDLDWIQQAIAAAKLVFADWGLTVLLGSLPFAIVCGWIGYHLTYRFVVRYRRARAERIARRRLRHSGA